MMIIIIIAIIIAIMIAMPLKLSRISQGSHCIY